MQRLNRGRFSNWGRFGRIGLISEIITEFFTSSHSVLCHHIHGLHDESTMKIVKLLWLFRCSLCVIYRRVGVCRFWHDHPTKFLGLLLHMLPRVGNSFDTPNCPTFNIVAWTVIAGFYMPLFTVCSPKSHPYDRSWGTILNMNIGSCELCFGPLRGEMDGKFRCHLGAKCTTKSHLSTKICWYMSLEWDLVPFQAFRGEDKLEGST